MPAFLNRRYLIPAAIGAAAFIWLVPMNDGPVGRTLVVATVWLVLAYGLWAIRDLMALGRSLLTPKTGRSQMSDRTLDRDRQPELRTRSTNHDTPADAVRDTPVPVSAPPSDAETPLDAADAAEVRRIVRTLAREGVFAPEAPMAEHLFEAVADYGIPVTHDGVLTALHEAGYYHPTFDAARCMTNLVFHDTHSEQYRETITNQIEDLARLSLGALDVRNVRVHLELAAGPGPHPPCTITMNVNQSPVVVTYAPAAKYLSTHLHVALAVALRDASVERRLAWLWTDQGVWISALRPGAVDRLNADAGRADGALGGWEWVHDAEPIAAGDAIGL